jgi:hypothetical protein
VIGLLQQAWQLFVWRTSESTITQELSFARRFAIYWRTAVAIILGACVIWRLLLAKQFVASPEQHDFLLINPFNEGLPQLCVLVALCNSLMRWRSARSVVSFRAIRVPFLWGLGIAIALIMLVEGTTVEFLVHRAVHNIERAQKFRRTGLYVQLRDEGYDAIWFGLGSIACLFMAIALATHLSDRHLWPSVRRCRWLIFPLLLIPPTLFCIWYYRYEFYRLSPDMAVAGFALSLSDLLAGAVLAAIPVTAGAYRLAAKLAPVTTISADLSVDLEQRAFHESFVVLLLLILHASGGLYFLASEILTYQPMLGGMTFGRFISFFCYPTSLLVMATLAVTIQLCQARWKTRDRVVPWKLHGLSPQYFGEGWIMLALLVIIGIPTIRAFAFLLWLGSRSVASFFGF